MSTWRRRAINLIGHQEMEGEMAVKKGSTNSDVKAKNGGAKTNQGKGSDAIDSLIDKNGNMLPAESRGKREEKCQVKRQGLKTTINTETNKTETKTLPSSNEITRHMASDGTVYQLDGKRKVYILKRIKSFNV